jgi:hypothetical protein
VPGQHRVHGRHRLIGQQHLGRLIQHPGHADTLELASGQLLALCKQLVTEVQPGQCRPCAGNVHRVQQVQQAPAQTPLPQFAGEYRRDDALARGQGR